MKTFSLVLLKACEIALTVGVCALLGCWRFCPLLAKKWVLERRHGTQTIKQIVLDSKCPALSHPPCLAWKGRNIWELSSALSVLIIIVDTQSIWPLRTHWVKIKILSISKITPQNLNEIL